MATEQEVIEKIRSYDGVKDLGDGGFSWMAQLEGNRSQIVFVVVSDPWLAFMSPFAEKDAISADQALSLAKIFGVCAWDNYYGLRNLSLIEDLDESEIVNMAAYIAVRADAIESEVGGDRF
jgi:hypothetical protein